MPILEPDKVFIIPFAESGVRNIVPETTSEFGRASLKLGFPPETSVLISQGGAAPKGADFNGMFYHITQYLQWIQSGGQWTYSNHLDYAPPAIICHNDIFYACVDDNGPGTIAGAQPPTNSAYWVTLGSKITFPGGEAGQVLTKLSSANGDVEWKNIIPAGVIWPFASQVLPDNFLECNGASLGRTTFARLFNAIGTDFGFSSASTFKLPDLRGKFLRGWDNGAGVDAGRIFGSLQSDAIRNITGSFEIRKSYPGAVSSTILSPSGAISVATGADPSSGTYSIGSGNTANPDRLNFRAADVVPTANENRPVNETVIWGIKY